MIKNFTPILAIMLVVLVAFIANVIIGIVTNDAIPTPTQKQIKELNPNLNTSILDTLKGLPDNLRSPKNN